MPSITKLILLMASVAIAAPVRPTGRFTNSSTSTSSCGTTATLPIQGATTTLPAPTGSLQYVALGRGTQNYTCSASGATPVAIGALATLYDATTSAECDTSAFNALPPQAVYTDLPASSTATFEGFSPLGHHYFMADGTPTFDLSTVGKILYAAKTTDIVAPVDSTAGPSDTGSVDWLQLSAKSTYTSVGLSMVYRVVTAGGNPTTCTSADTITIPYAAEYWFYN